MPRPALTPEELLQRPTGTKSQVVVPESVIESGRPKPPSHLCPDALVEFHRVSKILGKRKTETPGDYAALSVYCECYSRWVKAKHTLAAQGLQIEVTVLDSNGAAHTNTKLNSLLRVVENCESRLLALAKSLGLTPDTREKVKPAKHKKPPKQLTPEEEFFAHADAPRRVFVMPKGENE